MKKLLLSLSALAMLTIAGCVKIEDVNALVDEQAARIDKLEQKISSIQGILDKASANVSVTKVEPIEGGYVISFSDGTTATIKNGQSGKSAYQVAVANGFSGSESEWLESLKGESGNAYFKDIKIDSECVTITFNDQASTVVKLPLYKSSLGIASIDYVMAYSDGVARFQYTTAESARLSADFVISPSSAYQAVKKGVADGSVKVNIVTTPVLTKACNFTTTPVAAANITFNDAASAIELQNVPAAAFVEASASFALSIVDENNVAFNSGFVFVQPELVKCEQLFDLKARAGQGRVQIDGMFKYGMSTTKCVITWTPGDGTLEVPVTRAEEEEAFSCIVSDLAEGTYEFTVVTYDKDNNASDPTVVVGTSYGETYAATLTTRQVSSIVMNEDKLVMTFGAAPAESVETVVTYETETDPVSVTVANADASVEFEGWKSNGTVEVSTYYLPEPEAIDRIAATKEYSMPDKHVKMVAKSGFAEVILDNDIALTAWGGALWHGWDGQYHKDNFAHSDNTNPKPYPFWYTFDMGQTCQLCKYVHFGNPTPTRVFDGGSLKSYEIYGRPDAPADSSWDGWTLLVQCESQKPSGQPNGQNTQEDIDRWVAGEAYDIPTEGLPQVRYIRVKVLDTWDHAGWMLFSEFELYKYE